jgi:protein-disulfide isomerase
MKHVLPACAVLVLALGCSKGNKGATAPPQENAQTIADLSQRVDDIDGRLKKIETLLQQALNQPPEPDPEAVYSVPVAGFPAVGPEHAKVTIVQAYEYACGYCYRVRDTLTQLHAEYGSDLRVVYKPFIVHADVAVPPALAVCAADKQGKFETMSALVWDKGFAERDLGQDKMTALAREAGLDMDRYGKDVESAACLQTIQSSVENLSRLGVSGTPTFYINGRHLAGAQPIGAFKEIIDEELAKANKAIAGGVKLKDYYRATVIEGGKKSLE